MYLFISTVHFTEFCTYNDLYFGSIIHNLFMNCPCASCGIEKYDIWGVHLLTVTRHFPLSYEGVQKPAIEVVNYAHRMYYRTL
jgi:hypothetical protein